MSKANHLAASPFSILLPTSDRKHIHESFAAVHELEKSVRAAVRGEVRFDKASRALYATDASNYRQVPIGLVLPRDDADVEAAVAACRELGAPVLSRGGGTSLAGQCCNVAVVLDFSRARTSLYKPRLHTRDFVFYIKLDNRVPVSQLGAHILTLLR